MDVKIAQDWKEILQPEFDKPYFRELTDFIRQEYASRRIFPRAGNIFRAFDKCPFDKLKVVIIGQDPYHGEGQANGLCFSVADGIPFPPSLQNIFQEVSSDLNRPVPASGNLDRWAEQGVLLLNAVLTVRAHEAASHAGRGWGDLHRCRRPRHRRTQTGDRLPALGQLRPAQGSHRRPGAQLHPQGRTPLAALRLPGLHRVPPFLTSQCLPALPGKSGDRMVNRSRDDE